MNQLVLGLGTLETTSSSSINNSVNNDKNGDTSLLDWRRLGEWLGLPTQNATIHCNNVLDNIIDITTNVLVEDEFLRRLLSLQKLDLLDSEGVLAVFDRLIELCSNNENLAGSYIDAPIDWRNDDDYMVSTDDDPNDEMETMTQLLKNNPIQLPKEHSNIVKLCQEVDAV